VQKLRLQIAARNESLHYRCAFNAGYVSMISAIAAPAPGQ
jgi:hypothetical protein